MTDSQIYLLRLINSSLFNGPCTLPENVDWNDLLQEAKDQTVVGLVLPVVKQLVKENNVYNIEQWIESGYQLCAYFMRCFYEQNELVKLFEKSGIHIVIVKGYSVALYYPSTHIRTIGDIDFLVSKDKYVEAQVLMQKSGYMRQYGYDSEESHHIGYTKNDFVFELHRSMSSFGLNIDSIIDKGFARSISGTISGISFPMLPPIENGIIILTHIRHHLLQENYSLGLRQIIDWMMYVNKYCGIEVDGIVWDVSFMSLAHSLGIDILAITVTYICKEWIGLNNAPEWCNRADRKTSEQLLETIMFSGNFGSKLPSDNRSVKEGVVFYRKEGLFNRLQSRGLSNWKAAQKYRVLRPFAWFYQACKVIVLGTKSLLSSKKGIKQISEGKRKSDLLKKLGI